MNRREFCLAASVAAALPSRLFASPLMTAREIARIDHDRILGAASRYMGELPLTITAAQSPRSQGGRHDYFSEGDYWWPDAKNPGGPYIRRDGFSNPDNFNAHRDALIRLSLHVPALVAAWLVTSKKEYAAHAAAHLRAWFITPDTRMNPSLEFAQAINGVTPGRGIGIIDTLHLMEVARAALHLERSAAMTQAEMGELRSWFAQYLAWMQSSKNGKEEEAAQNNHGSCWVAQAAAFAGRRKPTPAARRGNRPCTGWRFSTSQMRSTVMCITTEIRASLRKYSVRICSEKQLARFLTLEYNSLPE